MKGLGRVGSLTAVEFYDAGGVSIVGEGVGVDHLWLGRAFHVFNKHWLVPKVTDSRFSLFCNCCFVGCGGSVVGGVGGGSRRWLSISVYSS